MSKKTRSFLSIAALVIIVVIVAIWLYTGAQNTTPSSISADDGSGMLTYTNNTYGFAFLYPVTYSLSEHAATGTSPIYASLLYSIILTQNPSPTTAQNVDGPPSINVDVYNYTATSTLVDWLSQNSTATNFTLPGTDYATTTLTGGISAVAYRWSGLYGAEVVAVAVKHRIILFTGMYSSPTDKIKQDFESLITSVQILP